MNELNEREQLAIAQALYSKLGELVSTKDPDSLRGKADDYYKALFEADGGKSFVMRIAGQEVGTYSIKMSKAKPQIVRREFTVTDKEAATKAIFAIPSEAYWAYIASHIEEYANWYFIETGELLDGCELVENITPEQPPAYMGGLLKVDAQKVANTLKELEAAPSIIGLLEGTNE